MYRLTFAVVIFVIVRDATAVCERGSCNDDKNPVNTVSFVGHPASQRLKRQATCGENEWRCADGSCISASRVCNGVKDCPDGSDEASPPCQKNDTSNLCILPPYPKYGSYEIPGEPNARPGQAFDTIAFNITCHPGYRIIGDSYRICYKGFWVGQSSDCARFCKLEKHPSVEYRCVLPEGASGTRECREYEPEGTIVDPKCRTPNYYYSGVLGFMRCINGSWDYVAQCKPDCGLVSPDGRSLIAGPESHPAQRGELPWHAGVYRKTSSPYVQICGGSLVSEKLVISAAHCFWMLGPQPASNYAVTLGKIYRAWNHEGDQEDHVQRSDVEKIHLPPHFLGGATNFQEDIALLELVKTIVFNPFIRPVCLSFDNILERRQLSEGHKGKVAGWGLTQARLGTEAETLRTISLPYISVSECLTEAEDDFRVYITGDKFCAGFRNGSAVCHGDSGGGLAFSEREERGYDRFYLRGVVSTAPRDDSAACNLNWLTTFTQISRHEQFIKLRLPAPYQNSIVTKSTASCILPRHPAHGTNVVPGMPSAQPGQAFDSITYSVVCDPGYQIVGDTTRVCYNGHWSGDVARCVRFCRIDPDINVEYNCVRADGSGATRPCGEYEPDGTVVKPRCKLPEFMTKQNTFRDMNCYDGTWDYVARCTKSTIVRFGFEELMNRWMPRGFGPLG